MANPQVHARSSARKFGGVWHNYIDLHSFLDSSKLHYAKASHRALLHHEFGKALAVDIFTNEYVSAVHAWDDEVAIKCSREFHTKVVEQHFEEDFNRFVPSVEIWFEGSDEEKRPQMLRCLSIEEQCVESVRHFGGQSDDYLALHSFIDSITNECKGAWGITHSTFGLSLAEKKFGYVIGPRDVPTRTAAEKHILAEFGEIPSAQDWLEALPIRPWMYNQATQLSVELAK